MSMMISEWTDRLRRIADPVFTRAAVDGLQLVDDGPTAPMEAFARTICGAAPWLERTADPLCVAAREGIDLLTRKPIPGHSQRLVEAALMALGILRAPQQLWHLLDVPVRRQLVEALQPARKLTAPETNWVLFPAIIEAFLYKIGESWRPEPIDRAMAALDKWYLGDGVYGDGRLFQADGYNSFVMHPIALAVLDHAGDRWKHLQPRIIERAQRHAAVLERQVASDGTFSVVGRSVVYRSGVLHLLAQLALDGRLPAEVEPGRARTALDRVMRRTIDAPGTFGADGFLQIGLAGHQPRLAETYINRGSLYFCTTAFLPLGLPEESPFWTEPEASTWTDIWSGSDVEPDRSLEVRRSRPR